MRGSIDRLRAMALALLALPVLAACAHVGQDELDGRLSDLRAEISQEIEAGDQQVSDELGGRIDGLEQRTAALESDLADMEEEFGATIERLETALRFNVPVHFGFDEAEIRQQDRAVLDRFLRVAGNYYPDALITVEGFTDPAGSEAYNMALGQRRADAVRSYLVEQGMPEGQIRAVSYGENANRQVADAAHGPGEEGWQNRRVVLVIDHGSMSAGRMETQQD